MSIEDATSLFSKANSYFVDENYDAALEYYGEAIKLDDQTPDYFIKRSFCHYKLKNYTDAIDDANHAIQLTPTNALAYLRKGMAQFALDEFESAKAAFVKGQELDASNATFKTWIRKCNAELEEDDEDLMDSEPTSHGTQKTNTPSNVIQVPDDVPDLEPDTDVPKTTPPNHPEPKAEETRKEESIEPPKKEEPRKAESHNEHDSNVPNNAPKQVELKTEEPIIEEFIEPPKPAKPRPSISHDWYQTDSHVILSIFAKQCKKESVILQFGESSLDVSIKLPDNSEFQMDLDLHDKIIPSECKYEVLSTKIEVRLKKVNNARWKELEHTAGKARLTSVPEPKPSPAKPIGSKNWDKIATELTKDEKLEGEAALNKVFQDIYAGASDDQRRSMQKSFLESGGTVLSTNWDDVKKGPVKGSPPKGMEMREWSEDQK